MLGDEPAATEALARAGLDSPPARTAATQEVIELIGMSFTAGAPQRAATTASWYRGAQQPLAPFERMMLMLTEAQVLQALREHTGSDALLDAVEQELAALVADGVYSASALAVFGSRLHLRRAAGWESLGLLDLAARELELGLEYAEASGSMNELVVGTTTYCDLLQLQDRNSVALRVCERFIESRGEQVPPELLPVLLLQRAVAYSEMARFDEEYHAVALEELREFLSQSQRRIDLSARARLELADVLLRSEPTAEELSEVEALLDQLGPLLDEQQHATHAAALRAHWFLAGEPGANEYGPAIQAARVAFDDLLREWRSVPRRRGGTGFLQLTYRRMLIAGLVDLLIAENPSLEGRAEALEVLLAAQAVGGLTAELGGKPVTLRQLRDEFLDVRHGCLVLLPGRLASHLFAFDRETIMHRRLPARPRLDDTIDSFSSALYSTADRRARDSGPLFQRLEADAKALADTLLDEEVRALVAGWERVTVVGSELFKGLPLECLPLGPEGELLGLTHAVDVLPSLPLALRLQQLATADIAAPALDLVFVGTLGALEPEANSRGTLDEQLRDRVAPLLAPFEEERTVVLLGDRASWSSLQQGPDAPGRTEILHILAHGAYDSKRERGAYLALASSDARPDGRVFASDIEAAGGPASGGTTGRLVLLSACASARGPERMGDDNLSHLGGAFLRAGARCVTLSRAELVLGRTLEFDQALHEALAQGTPIAEAVRLARIAADDGTPFSPYLVCRIQAYGLGSARVLRDQ